MKQQIVICSKDAVFARMLELELSLHGCSVQAVESFPNALFAEVVLLDLDSATAPPPECYRRMIGFTRGNAMTEDQTRRQCSMILRRPFAMYLLRREVLGAFEAQKEEQSSYPAPRFSRLPNGKLALCGKELELSPNEQVILHAMIERRGEAVSREALGALIGESVANKVDVYVCYLRKKLAKITPAKIICTVRNCGYTLDANVVC